MTSEILLSRIGSAGVIRLNRPKALNSLNLDMIRQIRSALDDFATNPEISCVIVTGEGERGLCAGGDIRAIYDAGKANATDVTQFWREEFPVNHMISCYPKPFVALMDGIVMGGGVGISAHGSHRIVTERTRLAMPETGIGYVPDVGATWLLSQAPGETGTWMGLTGDAVGAADAIYAGFADVCVSSAKLEELMSALGTLDPGATHDDVLYSIKAFAVEPGEGRFAVNRALIDRAFRFDRVEDIVATLEAETDDFAEQTREVIARRSPTSLKMTLRLLRLARQSSGLMECLEREFIVASETLQHHDFYEGVRAAIIDKDRNPQWKPATLAEVGEAALDEYFVGKSQLVFGPSGQARG